MIRSLKRSASGELVSNISPAEFAKVLQSSEDILWVDFCSEENDLMESILRETFNFHPLAIADALDETHVPKVDDWGSYLYIVVRAIPSTENNELETETEEIDIFIGKNYIVTYSIQPIAAVDRLWEREISSKNIRKNGAAQLLYDLIDEVATDFIRAAEDIDKEIDEIEEQLFDDPKPTVLEQIFSLKRDLLHMRRIIAPQREMVNKLARIDFEIIDQDSKIYFRDLYDHFLRLYDILENLRELIGSALEVYLSVVNNRMNNVMKMLTIITTLFMPISFLAGFFGMNFFQPEASLGFWTGRLVFYLLIGAVIIFPTGMYFWIRRHGWVQ